MHRSRDAFDDADGGDTDDDDDGSGDTGDDEDGDTDDDGITCPDSVDPVCVLHIVQVSVEEC